MSYSISLVDPVTKTVLKEDELHRIRGGMYAIGGARELAISITYNYAQHFYNVIDGEQGIRWLYGKTGAETMPTLKNAIAILANDANDDDYWDGTEGNAKRALCGLLAMAQMRPDGIWDGD